MATPKRARSGDDAGFRWYWPFGRRRSNAPSRGDDLIALIRERAAASFQPASAEAIGEAEESLDFAVSPILKRVLLEVGNGGFGPGHGLLGVRDGATDEHGNTLVDLYDGLSADIPDDPGWNWPEQLLPICAWGDSTYSCVDCSLPEGRMITYDANDYRAGEDLAKFLEPQDVTLEAWLRAWAEGVDLWSEMFPLDD